MRKGTAIGLGLAVLAAMGLLLWLLADDPATTDPGQAETAHATPAPQDDCLLEHEPVSVHLEVPVDVRSTACGALEDIQGLIDGVDDALGTVGTEGDALLEA